MIGYLILKPLLYFFDWYIYDKKILPVSNRRTNERRNPSTAKEKAKKGQEKDEGRTFFEKKRFELLDVRV
jgi:hypothetical protein